MNIVYINNLNESSTNVSQYLDFYKQNEGVVADFKTGLIIDAKWAHDFFGELLVGQGLDSVLCKDMQISRATFEKITEGIKLKMQEVNSGLTTRSPLVEFKDLSGDRIYINVRILQ